MLKSKILCAALAVLLSLTCFGCTEKKSDKTKITIALDWTPNTNHTGIYVANELGYFEEAGIEIEIIEALEAGAEAVVAGGRAEFGISFQDYLVPAFSASEEKRLPITAVAAIIQHNTSGIISPKELNITSPKELKGHTYATWELPIEQAIIKQVMSNDGASIKDVELIPQYVENLQGAFESGIDSVWIYYGWDGINAEINNIDTNFFYFKDYEKELDYYSPVIIANNDYIAKNEELTKAFLAAVRKGYEFCVENPEEAARILANANEGMDLELCIESQKWLADKYIADGAKWGIIEADRWNSFFDWVYENGLCEEKIAPNYGFTKQYLVD